MPPEMTKEHSATPETGKQHWAEAVIECVSDNKERERLVGLYDHDELVKACLALGALALTAKHEYQRAERLSTECKALRVALEQCLNELQGTDAHVKSETWKQGIRDAQENALRILSETR